MREILFRGKSIVDGSWCYGDMFRLAGRTHIECNNNFNYAVLPETVGQYTGLTDKNGTKIFEGDVFKFPDEIWESAYTSCGTEHNSWEIENYGVVGFCEDTGRFEFVDYRCHENSVEADLHENRNLEFPDFVRELEIVGNIHDNPELIGGDGND